MEIKLGAIAEGRVEDFTHEGRGVVKIDNFVLFVLGGVIGDKISFKITKLKKSFGEGEIIKVLEPSEDRKKEKMNIDEPIGAAPLIAYNYDKGLEWKKSKIEKDLENIADLKNTNVKDTIGMKKPYKYRNNIQLAVGEKDNNTLIGFYNLGTNNIVDVKESMLISKEANEVLKAIREWIKENNVKPYNKTDKKGLLRHIAIRINKEQKMMVILVTGNKDLHHTDKLIESLKEKNVVSIYQNINTRRDSATFGKEYKLLYGHEHLMDTIGEYKFEISPNSFLQVNRKQAQVLYDKVLEFLEPTNKDTVVDLYSGIGTIAMYMANKVKKVIAVESVKSSVKDAENNAKLNKIRNIRFIHGKTEEVLPNLIKEGLNLNKIVLDPPRKGCDKEVMDAILELSPERIVYVSCNSSTLSRDIKSLLENGYKLKEVQPVDMFPHTAHIECVIGMQRKDT